MATQSPLVRRQDRTLPISFDGGKTVAPAESFTNPSPRPSTGQTQPGTASGLFTAGGATDLRFKPSPALATPTYADSYTELGKAVLSGKQNIAATDTTQAQQSLGKAESQVGQASLGGKQQIAPSDFSGVQGLYGQAQQNIGQAQIGQYGTVGSTDQSEVQDLLRSLLSKVNGLSAGELQGISAGQYAPSAEAGRTRDITMDFLESLSGAPNRGELAAQTYDLMRERTAPGYEQDLQTVGQRAAALGRTRAGMTTNELTDVYLTRERDLDQTRRDLGLRAADLEMGDRLARLSAASATGGQFRAEDLADADMQLGLRDEARRERDAHAAQDRYRVGLGLDQASFGQGVARDLSDIGFRQGDERFRERDFQLGADVQRGNFALGRADSLNSLGRSQQDLIGAQRGEAESDRSYGLDYDSRAADLALGRAGAYGNLAGQQQELANITRRDAEVDRNYGLDYDRSAADLALNRSGAMADLESRLFGDSVTAAEQFRIERGYQAGMNQQEYENWLREKELALMYGA